MGDRAVPARDGGVILDMLLIGLALVWLCTPVWRRERGR